ncbi:MAG TPA: hypothetical protein DCL54_13820 [Alphaproteobacteria bacterium]|nr:hypothetical protein [Alphaproteobacteria bacterium]
MLGIALQAGGITQAQFEVVAPVADYAARLQAASGVIRTTLIFDNLFVLTYCGAIALGLSALSRPETRLATTIATIGIIATGLLDWAENMHFLSMLAGMASGRDLTLDELGWRMWASTMKWHIAYGALLAAGFVVPVRGLISFLLVWSLRLGLPVIGVLIYTGPEDWEKALSLARYAMMLVGFVLFAEVFASHARASGKDTT